MNKYRNVFLILAGITAFWAAMQGIKKEPIATPLFFAATLSAILFFILTIQYNKSVANTNTYGKVHPVLSLIYKFRSYFLVSAILLILMSILLLSEHSINGYYSVFGALFNIVLYIVGLKSVNKKSSSV